MKTVNLKVTQKGTPDSPRIKFSAPYVPHKACRGLEAYHGLGQNESREVIGLVAQGVVLSAVADDVDSLRALSPAEPKKSERSKASRSRATRSTSPRQPSRGVALSKKEAGFHNPYNFSPCIPRPSPDDPLAQGLSDGAPRGHDHWAPDAWQGWFDVELEAVTPLLVPDPESAQDEPKQHKSFGTMERLGRPWIPVTTFKGALRQAYECVTNSRLPRFNGHNKRLGFRHPAASGIGSVPVRIRKNIPRGDGVEAELMIDVLDQTPPLPPGFRLPTKRNGQPMRPMLAAWPPRYEARRGGVSRRRAIRYVDGSLPSTRIMFEFISSS